MDFDYDWRVALLCFNFIRGKWTLFILPHFKQVVMAKVTETDDNNKNNNERELNNQGELQFIFRVPSKTLKKSESQGHQVK